jgi:hypothetical protein
MNTAQPEQIMPCWNVIQHELLHGFREQVGSPKLDKDIRTLELVRIEEFDRTPDDRPRPTSYLWLPIVQNVDDHAASDAQTGAHPRRDEARPTAKKSPIHRQHHQTLAQMLGEIPTACSQYAPY